MVDIGKKPVKLRDPLYKQARAAKREEEQRSRALETAQQARGIQRELERPSKQKRYAKEMDIFDNVEEGYRGEVGYKLLGNKRLRIHKSGERTRKSGIVNRTTEVLKRDADSGSVYIGRLEREGWRKKKSYEFDAKGDLHSLSRERNDGSFRERWERDETGNLIRTSYFTNRLRDGRIFRAISEEMSAPYQSGPDNKKYRILTRRKGSKTEVFERDEDGNLELVGRKTSGFRKYSTKSRDGKTKETEIKSLFGSKSYKSLLDVHGNEVGRNIILHRKLLNKRSATFDDKTNQLTGAKHTFGKIYKSETRYFSNGTKVVSKKILGLKLRTDLKNLTSDESKAREMGAEEASHHKEAWKNVVVTPKLPSHSMTVQLGCAVAQPEGNGDLIKAKATRETTRLGSRIVATARAEHTASNGTDENASSKESSNDNLTRIRMVVERAQVEPQASNSESSNDRRMAMIEAAKRRDEAAERAGLETRTVACIGRG
ncbi:effector protein (plasmid) [Mesorhizobium mediterraneum]|uniref:Effector protein n=1 Tax=Mesorhizobium mediterraneum TaxID=43617 RepID=A0AB36R369_9HYPH|nr:MULTISPECIES: effector protein [Mesorhizobium]PAP98948.1 effector protein [Mesorhizobium mediterraneum]RUU81338.1 effector protein [Mesorhizobium sp. M7A.F.Ca.MR.362.00.0.0]RWN27559.1 MAG: effector protein [Mesorhizobium sp.]RWN87473.1 MAG: effector protein [Mesorhizobium sp.]RWO96160.1 MAG: effector protein [Mesorhizobium sp.]